MFGTSVRILSSVLPYPIFVPSYPLVGPNTQPHPSEYLLQRGCFEFPTLKMEKGSLVTSQTHLVAIQGRGTLPHLCQLLVGEWDCCPSAHRRA